jgi:hypothetical protein
LGADGGLIKPDRFGERGKGSIEHSEPDDLNQPFVVTSTLALDPIAVQFAGSVCDERDLARCKTFFAKLQRDLRSQLVYR